MYKCQTLQNQIPLSAKKMDAKYKIPTKKVYFPFFLIQMNTLNLFLILINYNLTSKALLLSNKFFNIIIYKIIIILFKSLKKPKWLKKNLFNNNILVLPKECKLNIQIKNYNNKKIKIIFVKYNNLPVINNLLKFLFRIPISKCKINNNKN